MLIFCSMLLSWIGLDLLWWWAADRRLRPVRPLRRARLWRSLLAVFVTSQLLYMLYLLVRVFAESLPDLFPMQWDIWAYLWHLVVCPISLLVLLATNVGRVGYRLLRWFRGDKVVRPSTATTETIATTATTGTTVTAVTDTQSLTRRQALGVAAAAIPPVLTALLSARATRDLSRFSVRRQELRVAMLPPDLDGLTIAHVSDLHVGKFLPRGMIERVAEATNALGTDLVTFTGDLIDFDVHDVTKGIDFIRRLDRRHGLVMIEGNHDLMDDADRFENAILDAGLPLLRDETAVFKIPGRATPVQFLGTTWGTLRTGVELNRSGRQRWRRFRLRSEEATAASLQVVNALRQDAAFPILLAHHPHDFDPAARLGLPLVLAGHTHGGQIMLTEHLGAGPLRFKYWTGEYHNGSSQMFVSNGLGNWFPLRLNAPAELVHLTLRKA